MHLGREGLDQAPQVSLSLTSAGDKGSGGGVGTSVPVATRFAVHRAVFAALQQTS